MMMDFDPLFFPTYVKSSDVALESEAMRRSSVRHYEVNGVATLPSCNITSIAVNQDRPKWEGTGRVCVFVVVCLTEDLWRCSYSVLHSM